jgi:30S ribosomal protein 3
MDGFILNFLWFDKNIAVSLNQKVGDKVIPLTEYFFWPQQDAWEEIQSFLNSQDWILSTDSFFILNQVTEVINCWENLDKNINNELTEVRNMFPNCLFPDIN